MTGAVTLLMAPAFFWQAASPCRQKALRPPLASSIHGLAWALAEWGWCDVDVAAVP